MTTEIDNQMNDEVEHAEIYVGADTADDTDEMEYVDDAGIDMEDPLLAQAAKEAAAAEAEEEGTTLSDAATTEDDVIETDPDAEPETEEEGEPEAEDEVADDNNGELESDSSDDETPEEDETATLTEVPTEVPKARLDKEVRRRKEAAQRVAELEKQLAERDTSFEELNLEDESQKMMDAMLDGNAKEFNDTFKNILNEVRRVTREETLNEVDTRVEIADSRGRVQSTIDEVIADLETQYAVFTPGHENFDEAVVSRALALQKSYIELDKLDPATALEKGAQDALQLLHPGLLKTPEPQPQGSKKKEVQDTKRKETVRKNAQAAEKQPAQLPTSDTDGGAPKLDIFSMSEEEFDALTDEQVRQLKAGAV